MAVMSFLIGNTSHPTVEHIYAALSPEMPSLSKTTVYNTLKILESRGAILALDVDPLCERFDADISLHGHAYCTMCETVSDVWLKDDGFAAANAPEGMVVHSAQLIYRGVCPGCIADAARDAKVVGLYRAES